jgi:AAA family ATP:ADP antiporter
VTGAGLERASPARTVPVLGRAVEVRAGEVRALLVAFAWFFALLLGYYVLRPIREEMAIRAGVAKLHWLFTATFAAMLLAVPLYSALVARVPRRRAVPWVYRFFLLHLLVFWALVRWEVAPAWTARAFYVWVSVYNLFVVSVFWSVLADLFTSAQGKRLFGFVAAGGSAGALLGSAVVAGLVGRLGIAGLLLVSAAFLEASARCAAGLARQAPPAAGAGDPAREGGPLGGSAFAGFAAVARSPYLLAIAAQFVLFSLGSTFLYFNLARTVAGAFPDPATRAALFAQVDLAVNVAALATQSLATGRIVATIGLAGALVLVPALTAAGFALAALAPGPWTFGAFQVIRRAAHFAVDRPAREVLFTVVPREDKYKAKAFVDTFVYRGGDTASGWLHAALAAGGLALSGLSLAAVPFAMLSGGVALWLARRQRALEREAPG